MSKCIVCQSPDLTTLYSLPDFPISMATVAVDYEGPYETETLDYCTCDACGQLQIRNRIPLEKLYASNHNTEIVGQIWSKHYQEFAKFLEKHYIKWTKVLEIGDPAAKVASILSNEVKQWDIVEPNPAIHNFGKVRFLRGMFGPDFTPLDNYDFIVHSHCIEHQYDIVKFLDCCWNKLFNGGKMCFSLPNMDKIMESSPFPTSVLNFEHPTHLGLYLIEYLLKQTGFDLLEVQEFENHSYFIACQKGRKWMVLPDNGLKASNEQIKVRFRENIDKTIAAMDRICSSVADVGLANRFPWLDHRTIYLYGSHVGSQLTWQYLRNRGVSNHIHGILDNSTAKQGQKLYGIEHPTDEIVIQSPEVIRDDKNPLILVSHMGIYADEIKSQLRKIQPNLEFV